MVANGGKCGENSVDHNTIQSIKDVASNTNYNNYKEKGSCHISTQAWLNSTKL